MFDLIWAFCLVALAGLVAILRATYSKGEWVARCLFCAFLFVFVLRSFFWELYRTEGPSMFPTLPNHSFVVVDKQAYGITIPLMETGFLTSFPKHNDVVAFHHGSHMWIKRVKGSAGDTLVYNEMGWFVNGVWIAPQSLHNFNSAVFERELPTNIRLAQTDMWKNNASFSLKIPSGYFFAIGDNPNHSMDSRTVGLIPYKKIVGRVYWRKSWLRTK